MASYFADVARLWGKEATVLKPFLLGRIATSLELWSTNWVTWLDSGMSTQDPTEMNGCKSTVTALCRVGKIITGSFDDSLY